MIIIEYSKNTVTVGQKTMGKTTQINSEFGQQSRDKLCAEKGHRFIYESNTYSGHYIRTCEVCGVVYNWPKL